MFGPITGARETFRLSSRPFTYHLVVPGLYVLKISYLHD